MMAYWHRTSLLPATVHAVETEAPARSGMTARQAAFQREMLAGGAAGPADDLLPGLVSDAEPLRCMVSDGPLAGLQLVLAWRHPRLCLSLSSPDPALRRRLRQQRDGLRTALEQGLGVPVELQVAGESGD
ncbi:hypothetical protein [Paludibacterium sp. THUN1379]|uniref:hypothetical protein n=1 Tax=Paludibacterium sp. THUN1379 TaxID=3112107 RepID=UPI0030CC719D